MGLLLFLLVIAIDAGVLGRNPALRKRKNLLFICVVTLVAIITFKNIVKFHLKTTSKSSVIAL